MDCVEGQERQKKPLELLEWDMSECVSVLRSSASDLEVGMYYRCFKEIEWNLCVCQQWEPNLNLTAVAASAAHVWRSCSLVCCFVETRSVHLINAMNSVQMGQVVPHFLCWLDFAEDIQVSYTEQEVDPSRSQGKLILCRWRLAVVLL